MEQTIINESGESTCTLLLAHGAGAGMDTPFMNIIAEGLSQRGYKVIRFEFPYMQKIRETGKKRGPNTQKKLLAAFLEQIEPISGPLVIGGKSMGGRIASMLADESKALGCICLGYPFHPPGKPEKLRTAHLQELATPTLILQGERDPFGKKGEVEAYSLDPKLHIHWIQDGEHSFKPRKKSGHTLEENLADAVERIDLFVQNILP